MKYRIALQQSEEGYSVSVLTIPRHDPVNAFTMAGIARDAGLSIEQFKALL